MITFSANTINLTRIGTSIAEMNSGTVDKEELKIRFIADILKDGLDTKEFNSKIASIYSRIPPNFKWNTALAVIEEKVFNNTLVKDKTTLLKNIIKTSTVGSNIKISDARNIFWESGFGSDKIMATPEKQRKKYQTPAAQLDSLSKEDAEYYWPEGEVTFDSEFLEAIGFPAGMRWVYQPLGGGSAGGGGTVTITYSNGAGSLTFVVKSGWSNAETKEENGVNGEYLEGNNYKNDKINRTDDTSEIIKYVETKEFGDVAQVLVYLDFVLDGLLKEPKIPRTDSVMITTDGVVHFLNCYFNLSSIYTGSRKGVESGCCTLYSYLAGDVNLKIKFENMIENYYQRIKSQLTATRFGLLIMGQNPSQFWYYRNDREKYKRTNGAFSLKLGEKTAVQGFFNRIIGIIDDRIRQLDDLKDRELEGAATFKDKTGTEVDVAFTEWCARVDAECKIPQILTKLTNGQYILHPGGHPFLGGILLAREFLPAGDILGNYTQKFINDAITIATVDNLKDAIKVALIAGKPIEFEGLDSIGGRHRVIRKPNNNLSGGGGPGGGRGREGSYYDYIFLCYVKDNMFPGVSIDNQGDAASSSSSSSAKSIADYSVEFAFLYDWTASQIDPNIDPNIVPTRLPDFKGWFNIQLEENGNIISGKTDKAIYSEGEKLQQYVYFADDYDAEEQQLEDEADLIMSREWSGWTQASTAQASTAQASTAQASTVEGKGVTYTPPPGSPYTITASTQDKVDSRGRSKSNVSDSSDYSGTKKFDQNDLNSQPDFLVASSNPYKRMEDEGEWNCPNHGPMSSEDYVCPVDNCEYIKGDWKCPYHGKRSEDDYVCPVDNCQILKPDTKSGGKRRTMKIKKYLKNNHKKTLGNNKKTLGNNKKTLRKNKKTRKSKH